MKYNSWLIWSISSKCSLNCHYCIGNKKIRRSKKIEIDQSIQTLKTLPNDLLITITSNGEPFCHKQFTQLTEKLTQHFDLALHTNLVSEDVSSWSKKIDASRIVLIIASFHYEELIRCNLLDRFFDNYQHLKNQKLPIIVKPVALPDDSKRNKQIMSLLEKHSCNYQFDFFIDQKSSKKYPQSYTSDELALCKLSPKEYEAFNSLGKVCSSGFNTCYAIDDDVYICHHYKNHLGTISSGIKLRPSCIECQRHHCSCPIFFYSNDLINMPENVIAEKCSLKMRLSSTLSKAVEKLYLTR